MNFLKIILIVIVISFFIFINVGQIKLVYRRYFKTYDQEINNYLKTKNLKLISKEFPKNEDWKNSPFEKPKKFKISLLIIKINGVIVNWTYKSYYILNTNKNKSIWVEIATSYFQKPILKFKNGKKSRTKYNKNLVLVDEVCPACGYKLKESDHKCPDCGLNFM